MKLLLTFILALLMTFEPLSAYAVDLSAAFANLMPPGSAATVNQPGRYQSGARTSYFAGGLSVAAPSVSAPPNLFSVTPPSINAGCGGISATFGGFSYISGAEFQQMVKSIASGAALGFVSMIVMKGLCPPCEAVVQFLKTAAQQAARLSIDSCRLGQAEGAKFAGQLFGSGSGSSTENVCGAEMSTGTGAYSDFLGALQQGCNNMTSAVNSLMSTADPNNPQAKQGIACQVGAGNVTWGQLSAFDSSDTQDSYDRKLLLMNLLGIQLQPLGSTPVSCKQPGGQVLTVDPNDSTRGVYCPPTVTVQDVVGYFMCGSQADNVSQTTPGYAPSSAASGAAPLGSAGDTNITRYCSSFYNSSSTGPNQGSYNGLLDKPIYTCDDSLGSQGCNKVDLENASVLLGGTGFVVQVHNVLMEGVNAVITNQPMPSDVIKLVQVAPFPLYQAINAAAVYPSAAGDIIDSMSVLVAEQIAVAFFNQMVHSPGRAGGVLPACITPAQGTQLLKAIGAMQGANYRRLTLLAQNFNIQQGLAEQIRQINLAIQQQVLSSDMLAQGKLTQAMNDVVFQNIGAPQGQNGGSPTTSSTTSSAPSTP